MEERRKPRRYRMDGEGNMRRTWDGRLPEEMGARGMLLFAAETDRALYGMLTVDTLAAIREAGFRYEDGELLSLDKLAAQAGPADSGKYPAVYRLSMGEAKERGELGQFWASHADDSACRLAIVSALMVDTGKSGIKAERLERIMEEWGRERVEWILAHSIMQKKDDRQLSGENRQWAASFHVPRNDPVGGSLWLACVADVPGRLLEEAANFVRSGRTLDGKEQDEKGRKESILKQLAGRHPTGDTRPPGRVADRGTGQER